MFVKERHDFGKVRGLPDCGHRKAEDAGDAEARPHEPRRPASQQSGCHEEKNSGRLAPVQTVFPRRLNRDSMAFELRIPADKIFFIIVAIHSELLRPYARERTSRSSPNENRHHLCCLFDWSGFADAGRHPEPCGLPGRVCVEVQHCEGKGTFKFDLVNQSGTEAWWKNDGPPGAILVPPFHVTLPVSKGSYSVILGDTSLPNMQALDPEVFQEHDSVWLRVWFSDGIHGFQHMQPDRRIAAVGYALMAGGVSDGAITAAKLAPNAAAENLAGDGLGGVATNGIVMSERFNSSELINAGYVYAGRLNSLAAETWLPLASGGYRQNHRAVWADGLMVVWGGHESATAQGAPQLSGSGARYSPTTRQWTPTSPTGAPAARWRHSAVFLLGAVVVWGGEGSSGTLNTGAHYIPSTDKWLTVTTTGAPTPRADHSAVVISQEMIVFGGELSPGSFSGTGGRYTPQMNTWQQLPAGPGSPGSRARHTAVAIGGRMYVWGGVGAAGALNSGSVYDPATNTWAALPPAGAPSAREGHGAVALNDGPDSVMIIWGGSNGGVPVSGGGKYNPATGQWTALPTVGAPPASVESGISWAGINMVVWGGRNGGAWFAGGGVLDVSNNEWDPILMVGAPAARSRHSVVWTGYELYVFGGSNGSGLFNDLHIWKPERLLYLYARP